MSNCDQYYEFLSPVDYRKIQMKPTDDVTDSAITGSNIVYIFDSLSNIHHF